MRSTLTRLRDLAPLRRLSRAEALRLSEAQAERLLRLSDISGPPVLEEVISQLPGIQIERVTPSEALAATKWSDGRWLIIINGALSRGRQRFSLALELKHILDQPFETILYPRASPALAEQAYDYFAACLLMPRRWLRHAWAEGSRDPGALARTFGVTRQAINVRLLQLGLIESTTLYLAKEACA
jgi:Zn-dependent peptidase ImmA (M78 family)